MSRTGTLNGNEALRVCLFGVLIERSLTEVGCGGALIAFCMIDGVD